MKQATAPKKTPFVLDIPKVRTGKYSLRSVRSGKTPAGDHYFVNHDGVAVRLATEAEIELWNAVLRAQLKFECALHTSGTASRYLNTNL